MPSNSVITHDQLQSLAQDFYDTVLKRENEVRLRYNEIPEKARARRYAHFESVAAKAKDALACNRLQEAAMVMRSLLNREGLRSVELAVHDLRKVKQAVLRGGVDLAQALQARYEGDFN